MNAILEHTPVGSERFAGALLCLRICGPAGSTGPFESLSL